VIPFCLHYSLEVVGPGSSSRHEEGGIVAVPFQCAETGVVTLSVCRECFGPPWLRPLGDKLEGGVQRQGCPDFVEVGVKPDF